MNANLVEVRATIPLPGVPDAHRADAERSAEEAYVLALLRLGDISAGRAAELLGVNRAELSLLMFRHGISPFDESMSRADFDHEVRDSGTERRWQDRDPAPGALDRVRANDPALSK